MAGDEALLHAFDRFVSASVLPWLKQGLARAGAAKANLSPIPPPRPRARARAQPYPKPGAAVTHVPLTFYVQRPPTLRLQPGPSAFSVRPHSDAEYGHQPGELNFWVPLTDAVCDTGLETPA